MDAIAYKFDDYTTSFYADNIVISTDVAGISKAVAKNFSLFPNPATNNITITNTSNAIVNGITITDLNGRTVKNVTLNGVTNANVNIAELSAGVYMMNIASDKGIVIKKIVKQ